MITVRNLGIPDMHTCTNLTIKMYTLGTNTKRNIAKERWDECLGGNMRAELGRVSIQCYNAQKQLKI